MNPSTTASFQYHDKNDASIKFSHCTKCENDENQIFKGFGCILVNCLSGKDAQSKLEKTVDHNRKSHLKGA